MNMHCQSDPHFSDFSTTVDNIHWESSNQGLDEALYSYMHIPIPPAFCRVYLWINLFLPLHKTPLYVFCLLFPHAH